MQKTKTNTEMNEMSAHRAVRRRREWSNGNGVIRFQDNDIAWRIL